jgi:carbon-monoxide dehydrogenase small subunit
MQVALELTVNGRAQRLEIDTRTTLVHLLREQLDLTGAHVGCAAGSCGACTVLLDGETVKSCCVLAADVHGREVTTVEALSTSPADLHPVQRAFVEHQGLQCGFCTPGMTLSTLQLLRENPDPSEEDVRRALAGNLCRCTGYQLIVESVLAAAETMRA